MKKSILLVIIISLTGLILKAQSPCDTLPMVSISVSDSTPCLGDTLTLTAMGGKTYLWNKGVVNGVGFLPSKSDTFQLITTDTLGCKDTSIVAINVLPLPNIIANSSSLTTCLGDSVLLNATGGVSYTWNNPQIPNNSWFKTSTLGANIFDVEGVGHNGCKNTSQVIVVVKHVPPAPTLSLDSIFTCVNVEFDSQIEAVSDTGRSIWFKDINLSDKNNEDDILRTKTSPVGKQVYYATNYLGGCYSSSVKAIVEVLARPIIDAGQDIEMEANQQSNMHASTPLNSTSIWSPETNLLDPTDPMTSVKGTNSISYQLKVTDQFGCVRTDSVQVLVDLTLVIANLMTPNGDGNNDTWKVYPEILLAQCEVKLFDGFGRTLLETDNYLNDWDGIYEGETLPAGNYYYHITGPSIDKKGTITLMR